MPVHLLIEGLVAEGDPPMEGVCPTLDRMAARGETGRVFLAEGERPPEEGGAWFSYFGHPQPGSDSDLPTGFFAALGCGLAPDPKKTWGQLLFTNLYRKQDKLVFLSPQRTGQTVAECQNLAEALQGEFAAEGWQVHLSPGGGGLFCHTEQRLKVRTSPLATLEGADSFASLPRGEHYRSLHHLLTSGQLIIARHPLNLQRREAGRLPINTPWLQGVAPGPDMMVTGRTKGHCWTQDPVVAGLAKAFGLHTTLLDQEEALPSLSLETVVAEAAIGLAVVHLHGPAVLARHGMASERLALLARMDQTLMAPLAREMAAQQGALAIVCGYPLAANGLGVSAPAPWLISGGSAMVKDRRFWHRQHFGEGALLDVGAFVERWR